MDRTRAPLLLAGIAALAFLAGPAHALTIDGEWCAHDGRMMTIEGETIITSAGTTTTGRYQPYTFSYTIPATEAGAGMPVVMILRDDETLELSFGPITETWQRCADPA